jgi:ABC-type uncharacterized transport system ATPase subunit
MTLELSDICLRYSKKIVLDNLSLTFEGGQIHALLGENGAGKSTTANIICGELTPDKGELLLDGKPVIFRSPKDAIQHGICYVHQRPLLADYITVKENLLLGLNKEQKERLLPQAKKWLPEVKLNSFVKDYGADTRFFIALTSALIKSPSLLILDEPSALLDDAQRTFLFENLRSLAQDGMNIIIITHNYDEAQKYCDTIDFLEDGRLIKDYKPLEHTLSVDELNNQKKTSPDSEDFNIMGITVQKGKITLVKGLAEDGLDELEKKLIGLRALRQAQGPQWLNDKKLGIIPTDRKFTGSNPNLTIEQMLTAALEIPENQKPDIALQMIQNSGVNIEPWEKCSCLSGGMLQKLMLEREFYNNPDFLILCNPLQGLDVETCKKICLRIYNAAQNGAYILILSYGAFPVEYSNIKYRLSNGHLEAM